MNPKYIITAEKLKEKLKKTNGQQERTKGLSIGSPPHRFIPLWKKKGLSYCPYYSWWGCPSNCYDRVSPRDCPAEDAE